MVQQGARQRERFERAQALLRMDQDEAARGRPGDLSWQQERPPAATDQQPCKHTSTLVAVRQAALANDIAPPLLRRAAIGAAAAAPAAAPPWSSRPVTPWQRFQSRGVCACGALTVFRREA